MAEQKFVVGRPGRTGDPPKVVYFHTPNQLGIVGERLSGLWYILLYNKSSEKHNVKNRQINIKTA
jgi:hypothetical protein